MLRHVATLCKEAVLRPPSSFYLVKMVSNALRNENPCHIDKSNWNEEEMICETIVLRKLQRA